MMNKVLSICLCIILIFSISIPCFAVTPYASVTDTTSQIQILIKAMLNDVAFLSDMDWCALRTGEYDYYIYFNIDEGSGASYYRYHSNGGYQSQWILERGEANNISLPDFYADQQYTCVGNMHGTLASSLVNSFNYERFAFVALFFLAVTVLFFVFRIKKRGINL